MRDPRMILGTGATVALFFSVALLPVMGVFLGIFTPLPLFYFYLQRGRLFGLTMIGLGVVFIATFYILIGRLIGVLYFLECALLAVALAEAFRLRLTPAKTVAYPAGLILILGLVVVTVTGLMQGQSPWTFGKAMVENQIRGTIPLYEAMVNRTAPPESTVSTSGPESRPDPGTPAGPMPEGIPNDPGVAASHPELAGLIAFLVRLFPALTIIGTVLIVWANFMTGRVLLARTSSLPRSLADLKRWSAPEGLVWVLIACGFGLFLPLSMIQTLGLNGLLILGLVYFFQGLSVVAFWMNRKSAPPFFRAVIYGLIIIQQYLALIIAAIGLFDLWLDFRRIRKAQPGSPA